MVFCFIAVTKALNCVLNEKAGVRRSAHVSLALTFVRTRETYDWVTERSTTIGCVAFRSACCFTRQSVRRMGGMFRLSVSSVT